MQKIGTSAREHTHVHMHEDGILHAHTHTHDDADFDHHHDHLDDAPRAKHVDGDVERAGGDVEPADGDTEQAGGAASHVLSVAADASWTDIPSSENAIFGTVAPTRKS